MQRTSHLKTGFGRHLFRILANPVLLLVCPACVARAESSDEYVDAIRAAAVLLND